MTVTREPGRVVGTDNADFYVLVNDDVGADNTVDLFGLRGDDELGAGNVSGRVKIFAGEGNDRITAANNERAFSLLFTVVRVMTSSPDATTKPWLAVPCCGAIAASTIFGAVARLN